MPSTASILEGDLKAQRICLVSKIDFATQADHVPAEEPENIWRRAHPASEPLLQHEQIAQREVQVK